MSAEKARNELKLSKIDKNEICSKLSDPVTHTVEVMMQATTDEDGAIKPTDLCLQNTSHLVSSITSSLADTPGDSGVQCLDSESSEMTSGSQALMYHSLVEAEELACDTVGPSETQDASKNGATLMTRSDIDNQNVCLHSKGDLYPELVVEMKKTSPLYDNLPDVVLKALESEKSTARCSNIKDNNEKPSRNCEPKKSHSEDIVYRRRCRKKSQSGQGSQKKRVSFHEDILNNTKTDNIHIERGFVTYGESGSYCDRFKTKNTVADRFSWCASGDKDAKMVTDVAHQTMSDILTYSDSRHDKSGIFEYSTDTSTSAEQKNRSKESRKNSYDDTVEQKGKLYGCDSNSSDSNFSCESETSSSDSSSSNSNKGNHRYEKTQKSSSCDGFENNARVSYMRKMYFSEADIDQNYESLKKPLHMANKVSQNTGAVKSVLKKKRYIPTKIVEENKEHNRKSLGILDTNNIIGSFKSFYRNFKFNLSPEKGLPEGTEDSTTVIEANTLDIKQKSKFLSKSLDSGFQIDDEDDFIEIKLNEPLTSEGSAQKSLKIDTASIALGSSSKENSPRHHLTLNMKTPLDKSPCNKEKFPETKKYVVNCESTVYEHKGVSYCYVHDTFQTAFNAPKESFVPLPDAMSPTANPEPIASSSKIIEMIELDSISETLEKTSTPKRQFNKSIQDESEQKGGLSKHLSSPKRQNVSRYSKKLSISAQKSAEDIGNNNVINDTCSNEDNSTLKGDELMEEFFDSPAVNQKMCNKTALLNRYLKNVCQKKDLELKIRNNKFFQNKLRMEHGWPSIIYPKDRISKDFRISAAKMSRLIDKEVTENRRISVRLLTASEPSYFDSFEDNVAIECSEKLRLQIFTYPFETLHRMLRVRSPYKMEDGTWTPLLVFITEYALYVAEVKPGRNEYSLLCNLPHDKLDAIAMGPECQYIQIIDVWGRIACSLVTGEASLGARLASSLEWSARTSPLRPSKPPAVIPLTCRSLATAVAKQRHEKLPRALFYGHTCSGEAGDRSPEVPGAFAPPLEGYLMCRTDPRRRFEPCYFLLRAGILHWGPHSPDGAPLPNNIALRSVLGVRRHFDSSRRPHCFEIALSDSTRLLLAAPDDNTASSWLQSLLLHAAQALEENSGKKKAVIKTAPAACTVLVTPDEVLSIRETLEPAFVAGAAPYLRERGSEALLKEYIEETRSDIEIMACGSIKNLTAFKIPDNDDNWCILEWSVCEARERGAGMALVLSSSGELERFIAAVETAFCSLTSEPFPLSVVDGDNSACSAAHTLYEAAWAHMLPSQQ